MLFENQQINTDNLPKVEEIGYSPLQKSYKYLQIIQFSIFIIITAALFTTYVLLYSEYRLPYTLRIIVYSALALFLILRIIVIVKGFPLKGYALRQHDIIFRTGILTRKITSIPINRIQHSEVRQSFLSRLLHISRLKIYTAGGSTSDLSIPGLTEDEAVSIKDFLGKTISKHE